jgi:hypothetical protein
VAGSRTPLPRRPGQAGLLPPKILNDCPCPICRNAPNAKLKVSMRLRLTTVDSTAGCAGLPWPGIELLTSALETAVDSFLDDPSIYSAGTGRYCLSSRFQSRVKAPAVCLQLCPTALSCSLCKISFTGFQQYNGAP